MRKLLLALLLPSLLPALSIAQSKAPDGGGGYEPGVAACITPDQRAAINTMLAQNRARLIQEGKLPANNAAMKTTGVAFEWPLVQNPQFNYDCYWGISNFVDHDSHYPNVVRDWNCGNRTYDLSSGYNHAGTDIFLWPFYWNQMERDQVQIVAAAPGTIIGKTDGNTDHNCAMGNANWNAVYIQHADGTVAWYGHMKINSLLNKPVGATVNTGEFLGLVGSSGSSTGPHLHFEVQDNASNILDPFAGTCNTGNSMWAAQRPYYDPTINVLLTHKIAPVFSTCPLPDVINGADTFTRGQSAVFAGYYHDQQANQVTNYTILRPDSSVFQTWSHAAPNAYYAASYWYWTYNIPVTGPIGKWRFKAVYQGKTAYHDFYVIDPLGVQAVAGDEQAAIYPNPAKNEVTIKADRRISSAVIYDLAGRTILQDAQVQQNKLNVAALSPGMYFICVTDEAGHSMKAKLLIDQK